MIYFKSLSIFLLLILLYGCGFPAASPIPLPSDTPMLVTATIETTSTTEPSPNAPTPTENPYAALKFFDRSTWMPEMNNYLTTLPARTTAEPGTGLEATYISEDKVFHYKYLDFMKSYLKSIGADTSSNEVFSGAAWENYDNAIRAYEILWKQLAQNPESYNTNWVLTPWLLRGDGKTNLGMYDPKNFVYLPTKLNGDKQYRVNNRDSFSVDQLMDYYKANNRQELIQKMLEQGKQIGFQVALFGINSEIPRVPATNVNYGVLITLTNHSDYSDGSVKIAIMGFQDENGKWVYQPFAVNLADRPSTADDWFNDNGGVHPMGEGYIIPAVADHQLSIPHRKLLTQDDLINLIGHQVYITQNNGIFDSSYVGSLRNNMVFIDGVESASIIQDGGAAPISPLVP